MVLQAMQLMWIALAFLWRLGLARPVLADNAGGARSCCMIFRSDKPSNKFARLQAKDWTLSHFWNSTATRSKQIMPLR